MRSLPAINTFTLTSLVLVICLLLSGFSYTIPLALLACCCSGIALCLVPDTRITWLAISKGLCWSSILFLLLSFGWSLLLWAVALNF